MCNQETKRVAYQITTLVKSNTRCESCVDKKSDGANGIKNKASELTYLFVEILVGKMTLE
jgi:hypothetical protein